MNKHRRIDKLLTDRWQSIVVQGGKLQKTDSSENYVLSGVWFICAEQWIDISAVEINQNHYILSVSVMDESPVPEKIKFNNPPRSILKEFPDDCRLDYLSEGNVQHVNALNIEDNLNEILMESPLLVTSYSNVVFKFTASNRYLGYIEISQENKN